MTAVYSVLHMFVDGVCALAMIGRFFRGNDGHFLLLLYNFCAFALQMPFGVVLDGLRLQREEKASRIACLFAVFGVGLTLLGAITHPVVLGIGNALFHVGGGVGTIDEDRMKGWRGRGLGVFVAPGAFGLYVGTRLAKQGQIKSGLLIACVLMVVGCLFAERCCRKKAVCMVPKGDGVKRNVGTDAVIMAVSCFLVVILRSYIGMTLTFSWKQFPVLALASVLAVVGGKAAGGFLAARYGYRRTAVISLLSAAICYMGMQIAPFGMMAQFLFNMTMPVTLYLLICVYPQWPGFAFGLLTFGLFLGFLPAYLGLEIPLAGEVIGTAGSLLSIVLLMIGMVFGG